MQFSHPTELKFASSSLVCNCQMELLGLSLYLSELTAASVWGGFADMPELSDPCSCGHLERKIHCEYLVLELFLESAKKCGVKHFIRTNLTNQWPKLLAFVKINSCIFWNDFIFSFFWIKLQLQTSRRQHNFTVVAVTSPEWRGSSWRVYDGGRWLSIRCWKLSQTLKLSHEDRVCHRWHHKLRWANWKHHVFRECSGKKRWFK